MLLHSRLPLVFSFKSYRPFHLVSIQLIWVQIFSIIDVRAAAKVAGVTAANSRYRSVMEEHPVYAAARNVVSPVSISMISSSLKDVKSGVITVAHGGSIDGVGF
ncbi:hypothetical protein RND71_021488 [Anisodus tanguticus]|uniref:Uncharacterized protein n=1 Tax=Anisodus tanguticus TaxID=243964 RepID=A0AAE1VF93_9SOLA|nr:hypothetical protein RND71_021488 [Anisodus tanguticus]